jgi:hypothetical protein
MQATIAPVLECTFDLYDGVIVDADALPTCSKGFAARLTTSLQTWRQAKRRGVWLKVRRALWAPVPLAGKLGCGPYGTARLYRRLYCADRLDDQTLLRNPTPGGVCV